MCVLVAIVLVAAPACLMAQEAAPKKGSVPKQTETAAEEAKPAMPDHGKSPLNEHIEAQKKWFEEHVGHGIPKGFVEMMDALKSESKKPAKDSRYIGTWCDEDSNQPRLVLSPDGTFTYDYGHSKGKGIWLEHERGPIWMGFAHVMKDDKGAEQTVYSDYLCYLSPGDTLIHNHIDYNVYYKRQKPAEVKATTGSAQGSGARGPVRSGSDVNK
ncbi:hypothetical protein [Roseimicrobium gellanilyticum]|nr:hypothetical protein [Roseimicrobium gellanilyticum]